MYLKSKPISIIQGDKRLSVLKIKVDWQYLAIGGTAANIKIYGISNGTSGETLMATSTLSNADTDYRSSIFQYLDFTDCASILWEFNGSGTECKLMSLDMITSVLDTPEVTSNDIITAVD